MTMRGCRTLVAGLMLVSLGCAGGVTVDVHGRGTQPIPPHITFAVIPTGEVEHDPAFPSYARLVARKLAERDYRETDAKVAKLGVYLAYGVTEQAATAPSSAGGPPLGSPAGTGGGVGYGTAVSPSASAGFSRYVAQVVLIAADLTQSRATGSVVELWRGNAQTTGPSKDLQALAPLLIEGAFRHFGDTTATTVQHTFGEEEIKALRGPR